MSENENNFESYVDEDSGVVVVSEVPPEELSPSMFPAQVQRVVADWIEKPRRSRERGIFTRDRYVTPGQVFQQMALAYDSADDDVVANVLDVSEALSFQKIGFECEDADQEDIWNQVAVDIELETFFRQAYRELFLVSQFYGVVMWGRKEYAVRGKGEGGRKRRKAVNVRVPTQIGLLDPLRIVPVQNDIFGKARLAWIANKDEMSMVGEGRIIDDPLMSLLFEQRYEATVKEKADLAREGVDVDRLILLNDDMVFAHSLTKAPYERWARIRMKSIFPLLDLKHQLREMDRAFLLGGINFIVLVTRGTDDKPTSRSEVAETTAQMRTQSKSPVIVSDHRIDIKLITPEINHVLQANKWDVLDERLLMKLWGMLKQKP